MTEGGKSSAGRFIVGTGRCGSTMLSKMIDLHPRVAVLSEFLVSLDFRRKFGERPVAGAELAELIDCGLASTGEFKKIAVHLATPEITFDQNAAPKPVDASSYKDGVLPDVMLLPLGHLFDDPEQMFHEIVAFAREQPVRMLSEHYDHLFAWIAGRAGKQGWIERSGGSIANLPELVELFPQGKFLHLHRDPLDTALSMQRHNHFRLRAFQHYRLRTAEGVRWEDLDESDLTSEGPMSAKLRAAFDHPVPLEYFLRDWSDSTLRGMRAIRHLAPSQYLEISFEEILREPELALEAIAGFFELTSEKGWIAEACALLREGQAAHAVPTEEQEEWLRLHAGAAMVLLGRTPPADLYR